MCFDFVMYYPRDLRFEVRPAAHVPAAARCAAPRRHPSPFPLGEQLRLLAEARA
jgi:hypothetical protein